MSKPTVCPFYERSRVSKKEWEALKKNCGSDVKFEPRRQGESCLLEKCTVMNFYMKPSLEPICENSRYTSCANYSMRYLELRRHVPDVCPLYCFDSGTCLASRETIKRSGEDITEEQFECGYPKPYGVRYLECGVFSLWFWENASGSAKRLVDGTVFSKKVNQ